MNWFHTICLIGILFAPPAGFGDANRSAEHRESFIDFALKQINPDGKDYGQCLEDVRRTVIESTLNDYYYWSNLSAIVGLLVAFCMMLRQRTLFKRRDTSTARVLCWYHNELFGARDQAHRLAQKYAELKRIADHQAEPRVLHQPTKIESLPPESRIAASEPMVNAEQINEQALRETIKKMERQAGHDKETLNSLRQQISVLSRRLQDEQQKNRRQTSIAMPVAGKQKDGNDGQRS